jgi:hypothetical protein
MIQARLLSNFKAKLIDIMQAHLLYVRFPLFVLFQEKAVELDLSELVVLKQARRVSGLEEARSPISKRKSVVSPSAMREKTPTSKGREAERRDSLDQDPKDVATINFEAVQAVMNVLDAATVGV